MFNSNLALPHISRVLFGAVDKYALFQRLVSSRLRDRKRLKLARGLRNAVPSGGAAFGHLATVQVLRLFRPWHIRAPLGLIGRENRTLCLRLQGHSLVSSQAFPETLAVVEIGPGCVELSAGVETILVNYLRHLLDVFVAP